MAKRWTTKEVTEFCGWDFLKMMVEAGATKRDRALIAGAFLTGGRISEVLSLRREHFVLDEDEQYIVVRAMPRVKCFEKVSACRKWKCANHCKVRWNQQPSQKLYEKHGEITEYPGWITRPVPEYRTFPIPKSEPLVEEFLEYLHRFDEWGEKPIYNIKRFRAYQILTGIGETLGARTPPHWFRAQRASQLAYEYAFDVSDLLEFFRWQDLKMAVHYASKGYRVLAKKMVSKV